MDDKNRKKTSAISKVNFFGIRNKKKRIQRAGLKNLDSIRKRMSERMVVGGQSGISSEDVLGLSRMVDDTQESPIKTGNED